MGLRNSRPTVDKKVDEVSKVTAETTRVSASSPPRAAEQTKPKTKESVVGNSKKASAATAAATKTTTTDLDSGWFEVEEIIGNRVLPHNKVEYLIKWKGYDAYVFVWRFV